MEPTDGAPTDGAPSAFGIRLWRKDHLWSMGQYYQTLKIYEHISGIKREPDSFLLTPLRRPLIFCKFMERETGLEPATSSSFYQCFLALIIS